MVLMRMIRGPECIQLHRPHVPGAGPRDLSAEEWHAHPGSNRMYGPPCTRSVGSAAHAADKRNPGKGQVRGLSHSRRRMQAGIRALQERLTRWRVDPPSRGWRPTAATVDAYLRLGGGWEPGPFLRGPCATDAAGLLTLSTQWGAAGIATYQEAHCGQTLLFADHTDGAPAAIMAAYRGPGCLENGFRQIKDPTLSPSGPCSIGRTPSPSPCGLLCAGLAAGFAPPPGGPGRRVRQRSGCAAGDARRPQAGGRLARARPPGAVHGPRPGAHARTSAPVWPRWPRRIPHDGDAVGTTRTRAESRAPLRVPASAPANREGTARDSYIEFPSSE